MYFSTAGQLPVQQIAAQQFSTIRSLVMCAGGGCLARLQGSPNAIGSVLLFGLPHHLSMTCKQTVLQCSTLATSSIVPCDIELCISSASPCLDHFAASVTGS